MGHHPGRALAAHRLSALRRLELFAALPRFPLVLQMSLAILDDATDVLRRSPDHLHEVAPFDLRLLFLTHVLPGSFDLLFLGLDAAALCLKVEIFLFFLGPHLPSHGHFALPLLGEPGETLPVFIFLLLEAVELGILLLNFP